MAGYAIPTTRKSISRVIFPFVSSSTSPSIRDHHKIFFSQSSQTSRRFQHSSSYATYNVSSPLCSRKLFQLNFKTVVPPQLQPKVAFSSSLSTTRFTTSHVFLSSRKNHHKYFGNLAMAAATVAISTKSYSTAVLQPQVDPLDETVDPVQRELLAEQCIVLNGEDKVIGHDTKRNCHRIVNGDVLLHRAFSVFLFNGKGELLLQQRSKTKITFPLLWTNTCCSHPLYTPSELDEKDAIGVRRAARRRLECELGIPQDSISLDDFKYLTRIHYKALSNSVWGEHEIDYILFLQKDDLQIKVNPDEIQEIRWVKLDKVKEMILKENASLTPWFELILNSRLPEWWSNLDKLKQFEDHNKIHRM